MAMFLLFLVGQMTVGWHEYNATQRQHGQAWVTFSDYLATGHPWEALFENWESEFLQMAVFVLLTTCLVQKGSPESRRLGVKELVDTDPRDFANDPDVSLAGHTWRMGPAPLRALARTCVHRLVSHLLGGTRRGWLCGVAADQVAHGQHSPPTLSEYLGLGAVLVRILPELAE